MPPAGRRAPRERRRCAGHRERDEAPRHRRQPSATLVVVPASGTSSTIRVLDSTQTTARSNPLGQPGYEAFASHLLGDLATHPDRFDAERGEAYYRQALALAEPRGMRPLLAHCHLGLVKLYNRMSKRQEAQEHLATATAMYREMDMRFWLKRAAAEITQTG